MNISEQSKKNTDALGVDVITMQTIEECGELIKAICKLRRTLGCGQKTEMTCIDAKKNLIEEIADVSICIEQMIYLWNIGEEVEEARQKALDKVSERYGVKS